MLTMALVVGAVSSASASAASWWDGGSELVSSAPVASATSMIKSVKLTYSSVTIECSGVELKNADIAASNGGQIEHLVFKGCLYTGKSCSLKGSTIESKPLTVEAALGAKSPEDTVVLKPVAKGGVFAEYELVGSSCTLEEEVELKGQVTLVLPKGREELAEQEVQFSKVAGELKWDGRPMELAGSTKVKLASGKGWDFH